MEESEVLQSELFRQLLEEGIRDVYTAQRLIASKNLYQVGHARIAVQRSGNTIGSRSGELMRSLQSPEYLLRPDGGGVHAELDWPKYIRFLDMKRLGNWKIYNRQLWGIMYKEVFLKAKYEVSYKMAWYMAEKMMQSFEPLNKK